MERHCLDGYEAQGLVWVTPGLKKATARSLCIHPNTQLLHQGAGEAGKTKARSIACKCNHKSSWGNLERNVVGSNPERNFLEAFSPQSRDNDCLIQCAYSVLGGSSFNCDVAAYCDLNEFVYCTFT